MSVKGQFVGFGFGAIQAGLFLYEAHRSGNFARLTVAEVVPDVVEAVRRNGGRYALNVATAHGIERHEIPGVEILNPSAPSDRLLIEQRVAEATELSTSLPSVKFYGAGEPGSVSGILIAGLRLKFETGSLPKAVIYTAENHNHAAEILDGILEKALPQRPPEARPYQSLNTVIGKMSGVVTDEARIREQGLARLTPGIQRCFLVEEFNRILITRILWPEFRRGIAVFEEKPDLLPFEEAKLYGHNATHALIGYLAHLKRYAYMADAEPDRELMTLARDAFIEESGRALCRRHAGLDPLFTESGYRTYAEDLLTRMVNPHLRDAVDRIIRDPRRKLGWDDRLVGTMRLALREGVEPRRYASGAAAAVRVLAAVENRAVASVIEDLWTEPGIAEPERARIAGLIRQAQAALP